LACWFCSAPTETHGDGSTTPDTSGHSGTEGFAVGSPGEDDGPDCGGEDVPCCVPHAAISARATAETPVSNHVPDLRTAQPYSTAPSGIGRFRMGRTGRCVTPAGS
jgi:hypothetical protein